MAQIPEADIKRRLAFDNTWWKEKQVPKRFRDWQRRAHSDGFYHLFKESTARRAVILMGPRRVGKTVMLIQSVQRLIDDGVKPKQVFYVSVDTPTYIGLSLEQLLNLFLEIHDHDRDAVLYVIFDEIQYHKDWERHLKSLVDSYANIRFVGSGSAAAALRMKSHESGAGRFTDFLLPPLSFAEFLRFTGKADEVLSPPEKRAPYRMYKDVKGLNEAFLDYTNFGGFPEAVAEPDVRNKMDRFVASDVLDKVLLRDIPSLYGIADPQDLKRLFTYLAYNTGSETSYENLSMESGVAKNTIKKYLDYLEAAFLIYRLYRVDQNARRLKRVTSFKVYLTNVSIRAALFGPIQQLDELDGLVAESSIVGQFAQSVLGSITYFARWKTGEVDLVTLTGPSKKPPELCEVKWGNRAFERPNEELGSLILFGKKQGTTAVTVTTRDKMLVREIDGIDVSFVPLAWFCYFIGEFAIEGPLRDGLHPITLHKLVATSVKEGK